MESSLEFTKTRSYYSEEDYERNKFDLIFDRFIMDKHARAFIHIKIAKSGQR